MRKVFRTIIFGAAIIACSCNSMPASFEETGHSDADWKLVFEENFDGSEVNASVWSMYDGPGHAGHGLRSPEAFTVEDGCLVITCEMKNGIIFTIPVGSSVPDVTKIPRM